MLILLPREIFDNLDIRREKVKTALPLTTLFCCQMMKNEICNILIIDDEPLVRNLLVEILSQRYVCNSASSGEEALELLRKKEFSLVLTDINLGGINGIDMIPLILGPCPDTVIMMISGEQSMEKAISAMRIGAFDYIGKPLDLDHLEVTVERALNHHELLVQKRLHESELQRLVKERTEELTYLSYYDALTNLPNSILFEDRLSQALYQANRNKHKMALLYLSIDRFEQINESLGHKSGYELLKKVARRFQQKLPEEFTISRFDRNEFAVLVTQFNHSDDIVDSTSDLFDALQPPFTINGSQVFITCNIGISVFPDDAADEHNILRKGMAAHARSKEKGPGNYQFYRSGMNEKARNRLELENNLRKALENQEFEVYYQPKIDASTNKVSGAEALVRWNHPEKGLIYPAEFISLAEESGLIVPIGDWVFRSACRQLNLWEKNGLNPGRLSINISARQFQQKNLRNVIGQIISETGVAASSLELELTESALMADQDKSVKTLNSLKALGFKVSIDDFGTGYSSLSYLQQLPIDILKIDRSFTCNLPANKDDVTLVWTIIELAHNLRLEVVAEGVETEVQLNCLRDMGCDELQGYYFSPPITSHEFGKKFLRSNMAAYQSVFG